MREHPIRAVAPAESGSDQAVFVSSRQPAALDVRARVLYNPELRSANFLVPGLMAVILTMIAALLTSNAMAREKERGTFEALIATPVKPLELMVGKLLPYVLLSAGNVLLVMLAGWLFFRGVATGRCVAPRRAVAHLPARGAWDRPARIDRRADTADRADGGDHGDRRAFDAPLGVRVPLAQHAPRR